MNPPCSTKKPFLCKRSDYLMVTERFFIYLLYSKSLISVIIFVSAHNDSIRDRKCCISMSVSFALILLVVESVVVDVGIIPRLSKERVLCPTAPVGVIPLFFCRAFTELRVYVSKCPVIFAEYNFALVRNICNSATSLLLLP